MRLHAQLQQRLIIPHSGDHRHPNTKDRMSRATIRRTRPAHLKELPILEHQMHGGTARLRHMPNGNRLQKNVGNPPELIQVLCPRDLTASQIVLTLLPDPATRDHQSMLMECLAGGIISTAPSQSGSQCIKETSMRKGTIPHIHMQRERGKNETPPYTGSETSSGRELIMRRPMLCSTKTMRTR